MRRFSRVPVLIGGLLIAAAACERDTFVAPRIAVPHFEVPVEEPVAEPVRISAREVPPPEAG